MQPISFSPLATERDRHRMVSFALALTQDTALMPTRHERELLTQFVGGTLTLEQVVTALEA